MSVFSEGTRRSPVRKQNSPERPADQDVKHGEARCLGGVVHPGARHKAAARTLRKSRQVPLQELGGAVGVRLDRLRQTPEEFRPRLLPESKAVTGPDVLLECPA